MGAGLSAALMPVTREPVTMISLRAVSVSAAAAAARADNVGTAAAAHIMATIDQKVTDGVRIRFDDMKRSPSFLKIRIWAPLVIITRPAIAIMHRARAVV